MQRKGSECIYTARWVKKQLQPRLVFSCACTYWSFNISVLSSYMVLLAPVGTCTYLFIFYDYAVYKSFLTGLKSSVSQCLQSMKRDDFIIFLTLQIGNQL